LKGISVVPQKVTEFTAVNPPLAVSLLLSHVYFSSLFSLLKLIDVNLGCLQEWGRNFDDMPLLPSEKNPGEAREGGNQKAVTGTSESRATVILLGVSAGEPRVVCGLCPSSGALRYPIHQEERAGGWLFHQYIGFKEASSAEYPYYR
jgi:hypothetical protein